MSDSARILTARYRVVTPMFLSGADQSAAELRLPSFKGALRFWWRALAAPRFGGDVSKLREAEDRLFGSIRTGVSRVRMRIAGYGNLGITPKDEVISNGQSPIGPGARYLGYGVMEAFANKKQNTQAGQLTRSCINQGLCFAVECRCRGLAEDEMELLQNALKALGMLGGLGSKSRKGYGSLILEELTLDDHPLWRAPKTQELLCGVMKELLAEKKRLSRPPSFTAISDASRHLVISGDSADRCLDLLDRIGKEMVRYRSWGHRGKILSREEAERNFRADHDLMKQAPKDRQKHPVRIAFGLPHNYGKSPSLQIPPPRDKNSNNEDISRRASPLFIHLHECGDLAVAIVSFMPADFLPGGDYTEINVGGKRVPVAPEKELWTPVSVFLDRLLTGNGRKETFVSVEEVSL